jgi:S1-C subfamily serine protease
MREFRQMMLRMIGFLTVLAFIFLALNNWTRLVNMPSLDFLMKSLEITQDPAIRELQHGVAAVSAGGQRGTGFNIHPDGMIITNYHIVRETPDVFVTFSDGPPYRGKEIFRYPESDLAVVKLEGSDLPVLTLEKRPETQPGDEVVIIGNPLGFPQVASTGEIIGKTRIRGWDNPVLMIRGPVHKGNSGSPVFNSEGKVIAVIFATLSQERLSREERNQDPIGLAVPVESILDYTEAKVDEDTSPEN